MELKVVDVDIPKDANIILGMSHFIKTVEDIYEIVISSVPNAKFGVAFCEASGVRLIRSDGTDPELKHKAEKNAEVIGAGHSFIIILQDIFPINLTHALRSCFEIVTLYCATANPLQVIVAETEQGRGILGVIDGQPPLGIEKKDDVENRMKFLRDIGYKRGNS
ncbi:MAG: hypothetical protein GY855_04230 [candidate division Zixibacteria bacterium]|nr:hypothetical protein [candidate division Zixibacteria bacterium]